MKKIAFTLVLNGMPFIEQQAKIIPEVFDEWHIIEGATEPKQDTSWCKPIDIKYYNWTDPYKFGQSIDGTAEFIDSIVDNKKIFVHRKYALWESKTEMCNQIADRMENCVLMQFDVDEIWKVDTLNSVLDYTINNQGFHGMLFKCNYYVGPDLVITNENCYGNYPQEWCRLWKIEEKTSWKSHEPPRIFGRTDFLNRNFTKSRNWTFDHYAYSLKEQVAFKENFYGYTGAVAQWEKLQANTNFPCMLKDYLPWVNDGAIVTRI